MADNINVSGLGLTVTIQSVPTFPQGFSIDQWPDDADPLTIGDVQVTDTAMGVNGDMITWNKANPIPVELAVIPNTEADKNLGILLKMNRSAKNKVSVQDSITMVITYTDGSTNTLTGGVITQGQPANSISSDSRTKTKTYSFSFANII